MLELKNVTFAYDNGKNNITDIAESIDMKFLPGTVTGIIGSIGSGKTTIAKICAGLLSPNEGEVIINGNSIYKLNGNIKKTNGVAGIIFQNPEDQLFEETVFDDIAFAPKNMGKTEDKVFEIVDWAIECLEIDKNLLNRSPFSLSKGEMRMIAIAGVIALDPEVIILDEPTSCLDDKNRNIIYKLVEVLEKKNKTVLWISHNIKEIINATNHIIKLENKKLIEFDCKKD